MYIDPAHAKGFHSCSMAQAHLLCVHSVSVNKAMGDLGTSVSTYNTHGLSVFLM